MASTSGMRASTVLFGGFLTLSTATLGSTDPSADRVPPSQLSDRGQFLDEPRPPAPEAAPVPPAGWLQIVNGIRERSVDVVELLRRCPSSAGGCTPWVSIAFALAPEEPAGSDTCACRRATGRYEGRVEAVLSGEILLYDSGSAPGAPWPFHGYDRRVTDPCTARAHEYGNHIEEALDEAVRVMSRFAVRQFDSDLACQSAFHQALHRAADAFFKRLAETQAREAQFHKVGAYPRHSRFGLGWAECS
jgi:hypothetical protein